MKLLFFVTEDKYFLSHRLPIALEALEKGFRVMVATKDTGEHDKIRSFGFESIATNIHRSNKGVVSNLLSLVQFVRIVRLWKPDIIHNVAIKPIILGSISSLFMKKRPIVVNAFTGMGFLFTGRLNIKYLIVKYFVNYCLQTLLKLKNVFVIVQNKYDRVFIVDNYGIHKEKISYIPGSGVDIVKYSRKHEIEGNDILVVTTCRMLKDKGIIDLYESACLLKKRGVNCRIILVGGTDYNNPSSLSEDVLSGWVSQGIVEYWGEQDDVSEILRLSHIFVLASYREGLSKSLLEAASVGLPLIGSDIPANREVITHNVNGLLVPIRNAFALANAIQKLVEDEKRRNEFGIKSRQIVLEHFSDKIIAKRTMELYLSFSH